MENPVQHPITLRFEEKALEAAFREDYVARSLRQVRYALPLGIVIYGLVFGLVDYLGVPSFAPVAWTIRAGVCLAAFGAFLFTYAPAFKRYMQPTLSIVLLVAGGGLVLMLALEPSGENYFEGPVLIILPAYVALRLRFVYATAVGWSIAAAYAAVAITAKSLPADELVSSLLFVSSANFIGMFAGYMLEDYARRHFWQARLIDRKRRENEELLAARSRFFANISHEFRTPLTLILGPLEDLLDEEHPPPLRQKLCVMERSARRLLRLINELMDLARLESGDLQLRARKITLDRFARGLTSSFSHLAGHKDIDLTFEAGGAPSVYADRDKLEKVIVNLVSNALKFTPQGGTVRVAVEDGVDRVHIRVRDSGRGIPEDELPHIFDRFRQADDSTIRQQNGSGLGLALTRELIQLHRGTITVESEPGFGSEFVVTLPAGRSHLHPDEVCAASSGSDTDPPQPDLPDEVVEAHAPLPSSASDVETPPNDGAATPTVLIVEDNPDMRSYVRDSLGSTFNIMEAHDGRDGLQQARSEVPDLVITDVIMPEIDGHAFCEALKEDPVLDHVPVVMLTAKAEEEHQIEGLAAGADTYLCKPFSTRELRARVDNLLANRRRLRQRFSRETLVRPSSVDVESADDRFIRRARETVESHMEDEHFNVDAFADEMGMSSRQLQRKLRAVADQTPNEFIRLLRIGRGAQLLEQDYGTIAEVAYAVGFSSPSYFSRCFRETFDVPPSEYEA